MLNCMILSFQCFGIKKRNVVNSLMVQWLELCIFTANSPGSIPGQGIPQVEWSGKKKKMKIEDLPLEMYYFFSLNNENNVIETVTK